MRTYAQLIQEQRYQISTQWRGQIQNWVSISECPAVVGERSRVGD